MNEFKEYVAEDYRHKQQYVQDLFVTGDKTSKKNEASVANESPSHLPIGASIMLPISADIRSNL